MAEFGLYASKSLVYPSKNDCFRPDSAYPEYPFRADLTSPNPNEVYSGIRALFHMMGLDDANYGTSLWNPLGKYISPGDCVLVKPNLVMDVNPSGNGTDCLYTHPSVIAAVIDYVCIALSKTGRIVLADAPMQSCDFDQLIESSALLQLVDWYRAQDINIVLNDMRGLKSVSKVSGLEQTLIPSAEGMVIDLGKDSSFYGLPDERIENLRITNYDPGELKKHHSANKHEYYVSTDLLDADVVINLPKAKTHRKAGVTCALKNMVGINVRKEYLPHHSNGSKDCGFDQYEKKSPFKSFATHLIDKKNETLGSASYLKRKLLAFGARSANFLGKRINDDSYAEGSWFGNDTIWRTVLDLNKIVFHANKQGVMQSEQQRKMLIICDMVVIGQGEGPLLPEPGDWKMLSFGDEPALHDWAVARMFGTDEDFIPVIHESLFYKGPYSWKDSGKPIVNCISNDKAYDGVPIDCLNSDLSLLVKPTSGWEKCFERARN